MSIVSVGTPSRANGSLNLSAVERVSEQIGAALAGKRDEHLIVATPGIGLGLHIVRNLVEAMGGTVTAEGNPWRGTTFTVLLPHRPDPSTYPSVSETGSSTTA